MKPLTALHFIDCYGHHNHIHVSQSTEYYIKYEPGYC